jgi:hypothetical protein
MIGRRFITRGEEGCCSNSHLEATPMAILAPLPESLRHPPIHSSQPQSPPSKQPLHLPGNRATHPVGSRSGPGHPKRFPEVEEFRPKHLNAAARPSPFCPSAPEWRRRSEESKDPAPPSVKGGEPRSKSQRPQVLPPLLLPSTCFPALI